MTPYLVPRKSPAFGLCVCRIITCVRKKLDTRKPFEYINVILVPISKGIQPISRELTLGKQWKDVAAKQQMLLQGPLRRIARSDQPMSQIASEPEEIADPCVSYRKMLFQEGLCIRCRESCACLGRHLFRRS